MQSNLEEVLNFELSKEDYNRITAIDFQLRLVDGIRFLRPEGPYRSVIALCCSTLLRGIHWA